MALLNHLYCLSALESEKKCLLVYQVEQRIAWHQAIDTAKGAWEISIIELTLLRETHEQVFNKLCTCEDVEFRARVSLFLLYFLRKISSFHHTLFHTGWTLLLSIHY